MAFDPDKYLAETPDFDPDQYLADPAEIPAIPEAIDTRQAEALAEAEQYGYVPVQGDAEPGQLEAFGRGGVQGATMGFGEEIGSAALAPFDFIRQFLPGQAEDVEEQLKAQGFTGLEGRQDVLDKYRGLRDTTREANKASEKAFPMTYLAGELAGGIAPAVATGGTAALSQVGKVGLKQLAKQGMKSGAKFAAIESLGRTEADLTTGDIGEIGEAAADVARGTITGGIIGGAIPVAGEKIGKGLKKSLAWLDDKFPSAATVVKESAIAAKAGKQISSRKALEKSARDTESMVRELNEAVTDVTRPKAQKMYKEIFSGEEKVAFTDKIDNYIANIDDTLSGLDSASDDAIKIGNMRAKLTKLKNTVLEEAGQDPTLPTKTEAYQKLLTKKREIDAVRKAGFEDTQAIDRLFDRAARMDLKGMSPENIDLKMIQADFDLPDPDDAIEMVRMIRTMNISRPKIDPESGMVIGKINKELRQVLKRADTDILESDGHLILRKGARPVKTAAFRPDELTQPVELTPQQLLNLRDELREASLGTQGLPRKTGTELTEDITRELKGTLSPEDAAKFDEATGIYRDIYDLEEVIPGISKKATGRVDTEKMVEKGQDFIEREMSGFDPGQKTAVLEAFKERVERSVPELGTKFTQKAADVAKLKELQKIAHQSSGIRTFGTVEAIGARGGEGIGAAQRGLEKISKSNYVQAFADFSADQMRDYANIARNRGSANVANFFDELANTTSESKKKALLFVASQRPEIREFVGETLFAEEK